MGGIFSCQTISPSIKLCLTNPSVFRMICLFEIADQMNVDDDPRVKILSDAPQIRPITMSKFLQRCHPCFLGKHGAMEMLYFKPALFHLFYIFCHLTF